ncbi:NDR1/HIN1-like protein 1 [Rhodamnia argentea]|uniref:NDR1/HIN1-like protein 1 n=1 Tax=Rhodamnia argentea TaxID=178133 RepID=A0A8B8NJD2_9MYRT|nr:NDR1/HIN1-like protein 1 [Rhodamnia argentea]
MTAKKCDHHHEEEESPLHRRLFSLFLGLVVLILFIVFLVFLILRPAKPAFVLRDATIYQFNASAAPSLLNTNMQVTLSSRNPNERIGIYYQMLDTYVSYRGQQISLPTLLPDSYQGHKEVINWSPFLYGSAVPVSPFLTAALEQDRNAGSVLVDIKVDGRVKWKVGTWVSGKYHLHVNCPALLVFKEPCCGIAVGPSVKIQVTQHCTVDV